MKIELKNKDAEILCQLAYLGEKVINGCRKTREQLQKYCSVKDILFCAYREKNGFSYDRLNELLFEETISFLQDYEKKSMPAVLAQICADYAFAERILRRNARKKGGGGRANRVYTRIIIKCRAPRAVARGAPSI